MEYFKQPTAADRRREQRIEMLITVMLAASVFWPILFLIAWLAN